MNDKTPKLAVDCIVLTSDKKSDKRGIVLIKRKHPPYGYALPGGFVDVGETTKQAAIREMKEELNLNVRIINMFGIYDNPNRDTREHVVSIVYVAVANNLPIAGDDAKEAFIWEDENADMPKMAFDHENILNDFLSQ